MLPVRLQKGPDVMQMLVGLRVEEARCRLYEIAAGADV